MRFLKGEYSIAAKTTANGSSVPRTFACLAIWAARFACGRPDAEKIGSFDRDQCIQTIDRGNTRLDKPCG